MSVLPRLSSYSAYQKRVCGLIGIPVSGLNDTEKDFIQGFYATRAKNMWQNSPWLDVSPYGEARFAGNLLTYPNDLTKTAYWTASGVTPTLSATNPQFANPADGRKTATLLSETATTAVHNVVQSYNFLPNINYQYSAYIRSNGRNFVRLSIFDGTTTFSAFFNTYTGVLGTTANTTNTPTIIQQNNGYWLCTLFITSSATAGSGNVTTSLSNDGSNLTYAGSTSAGVYSWGNLLLQTSYADPSSIIIPWEQTGEDNIDSVVQVWRDSPVSAINPRAQGYELTPNGIQLVGPGGYAYGVWYVSYPNGYTPAQFPVFLYYRKQCPDYTANNYDATLTYSVDDQVLFEVTGNGGNVTNFYKCVVATSAGQSPTSAPTNWELIPIYEVFFLPSVYGAYAEWLRMDGQIEKSLAMDAVAQRQQDDAADKQERQDGWIPPIKIATHVTSQFRR